MTRFTINAFGATKDIFGQRVVTIELGQNATVANLKHFLQEKYPELKSLKSLFVAVNHEYAGDDVVLTASDEIALIPPVSGG